MGDLLVCHLSSLWYNMVSPPPYPPGGKCYSLFEEAWEFMVNEFLVLFFIFFPCGLL